MRTKSCLSFILSILFVLCLFVPAVHAEEPSHAGLYILTPRVSRGAKVYAVDKTADHNLDTSIEGYSELGEIVSSLNALDGNLDGYRLANISEMPVDPTVVVEPPLFYGTGALADVSMPFSYYDAGGKPSGQFFYAENYSGGALSYLSRMSVTSASCSGADYSKISLSADSLNRLALNPSASRENPFVLYALDCGAAAVTLDGKAVVSLSVKGGYTSLEVRLAARALHKKREAKVLPGEEVVCATSVLPKEQLFPQYGWTFSSLTAAGSLGFNKLLAEQNYPFHDFTFRKVKKPAQTPALYTGTQEVATKFGVFRLEAYVQGERTDVFAVLPSGKNRNVRPGDTEESIRDWAEKALWKEQLTARMRDALSGTAVNPFCPEVQPYKKIAASFLGEAGSAFDTKDGWTLCQTLWMERPRDYYGDWLGEILLFACANAPEGSDPAKAEISVLAYFRMDNTYSRSAVLSMEPGESLPHFIGRLRENVPLKEMPFPLAPN